MPEKRRPFFVMLVIATAVCSLAARGSSDEMMPPLSSPITFSEAVHAIQDLDFDAFIDESYRRLLLRDPDSLWYSEGAGARTVGLVDLAAFTDVSLEGLETTRQIEEAFRDHLLTFDREGLSLDQIIAYDSYLWILTDRLEMSDYPLWNLCIGPGMYGLQGRLDDLLEQLPVDNLEDAEAYIRRLQNVDEWFAQWIDTLRSRETSGVIPPRYELESSLAVLDGTLGGANGGAPNPETLPAYTHFRDKLAALPNLSTSERQALLASARNSVLDHVIPGLQSLREYIESLQDQSGDNISVSRYEGGADYFATLVRHHTTSAITIDEVRLLGQQEVARLQAEMRSFAATELGWPDDLPMAELNSRLDVAKQPLVQGQALLAEYERLLAEADVVLDDAFMERPTAGVEVRVDSSGCWACYAPPGSVSDTMGYMMTNLANLGAFTQYDEPVLVHHESIPGHHYQIALAMDLDVALPQTGKYRGDFYYIHPKLQAFSEGWALYAERLAVDLGLYEGDPLSYLLSLRLWLNRTARLVVQVGLHEDGWAWEDVVSYLREATGVEERTNRLLFHISYPAQACSYSIFSLFVLDIRQRAMDVLGERFDLRAFHHELLCHGLIPLQVLENVMNDWIERMSQS